MTVWSCRATDLDYTITVSNGGIFQYWIIWAEDIEERGATWLQNHLRALHKQWKIFSIMSEAGIP